MKTAEIKELSVKEIQERLDVESSNLVRMKLNHAVSPLDNPMKIRELRKVVAQLKTELRSRSLSETK
ncbi:MAG: 50S ribosomal protein L29 [Bacteroidales bacterium]|jgi:large subunit ribosomal protein L29|nr:50S ribosomal protein L29 [Bacteroidales bacterium]